MARRAEGAGGAPESIVVRKAEENVQRRTLNYGKAEDDLTRRHEDTKVGKTAKACSRFGHERSEVARRAEGAGGAPESIVVRKAEENVQRRTSNAEL